MAIDWSHLPKEVIAKVCMCPMANGFSLEPASGYYVHAKCRKPTIPVAVKQCDICDKVFVPNTLEECHLDFMGLMCYDCQPPRKTS